VYEFYHEDPYIEVEGSFHQPNGVGLEAMDGRVAIHVAGWPFLPSPPTLGYRILL
jgi:hypothetical protein